MSGKTEKVCTVKENFYFGEVTFYWRIQERDFIWDEAVYIRKLVALVAMGLEQKFWFDSSNKLARMPLTTAAIHKSSSIGRST